MSVSGNSIQSCFIDDGWRSAGDSKFVFDIPDGFFIRHPLEVVMDGDPLFEGFMDRLVQDVVQMRLASQDQGETVD